MYVPLRCLDTLSCFPTFFTKGNNCYVFLFVLLDDKTLPTWSLFIKKRVCFLNREFIPLRESRKENPQNPIALRKVKIVYNFGLSECNRVKSCP